MGAAFGWGLISASSFVIGSLVATWLNIGLRTIGLMMGFGAGVLISAVAFEMVDEIADESSGQGAVASGLFVGCAVVTTLGLAVASSIHALGCGVSLVVADSR
jgi:zinc transporter, ZIP family